MSGAHLAVTGGLPPRVFPLGEGSFIAGRSADTDFELSHVEISRQHCRFSWDGKTCTIEDLGSVRGTRVNGQRISAITTLQPGDQVMIGPAIIVFGHGDKSASGPTVAPATVGAGQMLVLGKPADRIEVDRLLTIGREPGLDVWQ